MGESFSPVQALDQGHLSEINELVSTAFGYRAPHTFFDDFPLWATDSQKNNILRLGIFSENGNSRRLAAHVGIHFATMQVSTGKVKVALIGAVATDKDFRGKGLSTLLLNEALSHIGHAGAEWTFLWGSEHHFYKKFGFELMGLQGRASLLDTREIPKGKIAVQTGITEKIFQHLLHQKTGLLLEENDRDWFFKHKTVQWYFVEEPFAFIGFGRGMDLHHLIHEWGGDPDSLRSIFAEILTRDPLTGILGQVPDLLALGFEKNAIIEEYLCLARPTPSPIGSTASWNSDFWISGLGAC